jgi:BirA family biotin operon repressor/biotin-[acetyl-CoA-carboxylase] ligase
MTTMHDVERALAAAGIEAPADWQEVTASTNATALEMATRGAPQWSLAAAAHQTEGRGRLGRTWEDDPGRALMFSVVLRPSMTPQDAGLLPLLAGAAMAEACTELSDRDVRCRWPNDLIVGDAKLGGVLAESAVDGERLRHVVLGVGVNLEAPASVAGAEGLGASVEPLGLLTRFLIAFRSTYELEPDAFAPATIARWMSVSVTLGREVVATSLDGDRVTGEAVGIDARGALIVRTAKGPVTVASGELLHLR